MSVDDYCIEHCATDLRVEALRLLHDGLSPDQQTVLPTALDEARQQRDDALAGLLVARDAGGLRGVVWVQLAPGRTAVVWPPAVGGAWSADLMRAAGRFVDERGVVLAQILVSPDAPQDLQALSAGGFQRFVELAYLAIERPVFPTASPESELTFVPAASEQPKRLGRLLLETYRNTLDCPQLNDLRDEQDILAGYAAQGVFAPERWFFVEHQGRDVGVLLLTAHGAGDTWELVYMGVVPEVRGRSFGRQIVRFALAQADAAGAQRLVLAVDEANTPGLAMYRDAGLVAWDHRVVYARLNRQASDPA